MTHRSDAGLSRLGAVSLAITVTALLAVPAPAAAQQPLDYPVKPIRMVVPQSPGSASDTLARVLAPALGEALGQSVIIDNRSGAGGLIGAEMAAKSIPDGYTVLLGASAWISIAPHTYRHVLYDAVNDFASVSLFAIGQSLLVVGTALPVNSLQDLIAMMKARPGRMNMASAGVGSASHLAGLLLTTLSGTSVVHVPFKGAGLSVVSVMTGESDWTFTPMQGPLPQVRAGKLKALAVGGASRSQILPDVPTVIESGYPEYYSGTWYGLMLPRDTPRAVVDRLNAAVRAAVEMPALREQIVNQGADPKSSTPEEMAVLVRTEFERFGELVRRAGVTAE
jgi:tripartite-type tricarboxylate transporter receptor subunit TctC